MPPPPDPATLSRLIDSLRHRGPDSTGHAIVGRIALAHNRLSIIDMATARDVGLRRPDRRDHAATVAKALDARHETIEISERMVWRHLPEIVGCLDDPVADHAIIPTWFLAQRARQDVKVVLSGDRRGRNLCRFSSLPERNDAVGARCGRVAALTEWMCCARARHPGASVAPLRRPRHWKGGRSRLAAAWATDMAHWVPHGVLLKLDRCLMAHCGGGTHAIP